MDTPSMPSKQILRRLGHRAAVPEVTVPISAAPPVVGVALNRRSVDGVYEPYAIDHAEFIVACVAFQRQRTVIGAVIFEDIIEVE